MENPQTAASVKIGPISYRARCTQARDKGTLRVLAAKLNVRRPVSSEPLLAEICVGVARGEAERLSRGNRPFHPGNDKGIAAVGLEDHARGRCHDTWARRSHVAVGWFAYI